MRLAHRLLLQSLAGTAVLVVAVAVLENRLHASIVEQATRDLVGEARLLAANWRSGVNADALANLVGAATGHRTTLIDSAGRVVGDSELDGPALEKLENHATLPEIVAARNGAVGLARRTSPPAGEEQLYVAVPAPLGVARVSVITMVIEGPFDRARRGLLVATAVSVLLAAMMASLFSRAVSKPITDLRDVTRSLAAGELTRRPALAAPGEVGELADAIHRLAEQLQTRLSALAAEQSILASLVETLNEGVIAISGDQMVVRINDIARRLLSIDRPLPFAMEYLPRETTLRNAISLAIRGTATDPEEVVIGDNTLSLTARPLITGGVVVAFFDLTPMRRLEAVRRDFVANVSHELRTPLTIVGGFAETLQDPDVPSDKRAEFARTILANTERMQRIVDELLDLSRIESGHWQPRPQTVRVTDIATEVFPRISATAKEKGIVLLTEIDPRAETVYADRTALEQILVNLTENALRHTVAGTITISTAPEQDGTVISVTDTGAGISPEHLPRIFERFYRADTGRSRETGGTGLGLAIVRHLTEAHEGKATAESTVGVGTTIRIFFPRGAAEDQS